MFYHYIFLKDDQNSIFCINRNDSILSTFIVLKYWNLNLWQSIICNPNLLEFHLCFYPYRDIFCNKVTAMLSISTLFNKIEDSVLFLFIQVHELNLQFDCQNLHFDFDYFLIFDSVQIPLATNHVILMTTGKYSSRCVACFFTHLFHHSSRFERKRFLKF